MHVFAFRMINISAYVRKWSHVLCSILFWFFAGFFLAGLQAAQEARGILFFQRSGLDMPMIAWLAYVEKHRQIAQQLFIF